MNPLNNREDRIPTSHLLALNEALNTETGLHPMNCWPKGSHGNPQTIKAVAKSKVCSAQTDKAITLDWTYKTCMPTQSLHTCMLFSLVQEGTLHVNKGET